MNKMIYTLTAILILILAAVGITPCAASDGTNLPAEEPILVARSGLDMTFQITLKEGYGTDYVQALDAVTCGSSALIPGNRRTYRMVINDDPRTEDQYLYLFSNLPGIEKLNGKPVTPRLESEDFPEPTNSMAAVLPDSGTPEYVTGEVLLKLKPNVPPGTIHKINTAYGTRVIRHIEGLDVYKLSVPRGYSTKTYARILGVSPHVAYAELNKVVRINR